jgi:pimeloyl-ACP methyl ester carboxylesterase
MRTSFWALAMTFAVATGSASGQTIGPGNGEHDAALPGGTLQVSTFRPDKCAPKALLVVFHGSDRDAGPYRDRAKSLANKLCAIAVAPKFDAGRFPRDLYQYGGVADHGKLLTSNRSVDFVEPLITWAQGAAGRPGLPYILIGHSAGGQFLSRVAAYSPQHALRIVIANPSTWVMPTVDASVPFGFGKWKPSPEQSLQAYLAQPIVVDLGAIDTGSDNLDITADGQAQGANRLARGRNAFEMGKAAAGSRGWSFNWTLIEVPNVGHSSSRMFNAGETVSALQSAIASGR